MKESATKLSKDRIAYFLLAFLCLAVSLLVAWSSHATRINNAFYDLYFHQRSARPAPENIVIVAIDDATLSRYGTLPLNRSLLARAVRAIQQARPRVLAIDMLLTDVSSPEADRDLESAFAAEPHPVLSTALEANTGARWLLPRPQFAALAAAIGHAHADPDGDGVSRQVLLEKHAVRQRYWALALECLRVEMGAPQVPITETPDNLEVEGAGNRQVTVPASWASGRAMLINYAGREGAFRQVSMARLLDDPAVAGQLRDKIVLLGVTAQGAGDRYFTPLSFGAGMPGVEIHANILHTLLTGDFLLPAGNLAVALTEFAIGAVTAAALVFFHGPALIAFLIALAGLVFGGPYWLFLHGHVWPAFSLLIPFAVTLLVCGVYQLLKARRTASDSEARRHRSQQQFEMATHEIRTPLTAIQASSEILTRYPLDEAKRKQMLDLIYDESQRLGKMVERFLSVEKLAAGEMELQRQPVDLSSIVSATIERLSAAADRKRIKLVRDDMIAKAEIEGDPELLEFAVSNLVNNAVKYSPAGASVRLKLECDQGRVRIHVTDSGSGMTDEERRKIFDRFYRTESAKVSGAPGFGLGLTVARQIALLHGGDLDIISKPGRGSRFTISLPAEASALHSAQAAR